MSNKILTAISFFLLLNLQTNIVPCVWAGSVATPNDMVLILRNSNVVPPQAPIHVSMDDKRALILTERNPKAKDNDCKIDAALMAKQLIDSYPSQISRVRVILSVPGSEISSQIDVTAGDVKAFASGSLTREQFISSLEIVKITAEGGVSGNSSSGLSVAPGPLNEQRVLLLGRIDNLRAHRTGVKPFQALFDKIEESVKAGADEKAIQEPISQLSDSLAEQEQLLRIAKANPLGVTKSNTPFNTGSNKSSAEKAFEINQRVDRWYAKILSQSAPSPVQLAHLKYFRDYAADTQKQDGILRQLDRWDESEKKQASQNKQN